MCIGNVREFDRAAKLDGHLFEPWPGVEFVKMRMRAQTKFTRRCRAASHLDEPILQTRGLSTSPRALLRGIVTNSWRGSAILQSAISTAGQTGGLVTQYGLVGPGVERPQTQGVNEEEMTSW